VFGNGGEETRRVLPEPSGPSIITTCPRVGRLGLRLVVGRCRLFLFLLMRSARSLGFVVPT
jgi:hypothetical protein